MKRELIIAWVVMGLCSSCAHMGQYEVPSKSARAPQIEKAMNLSVIPVVDLQNVSLDAAVKYWATASQTYHPQHFEFLHGIVYPTSFTLQPTKQGGAGAMTHQTTARPMPKITVRRKNITSKRLLDEICRQSNSVWTILGRVVAVEPQATVPKAQP